MNNGWIRIHRKLQDKAFYKKPHYLALWIHILLKANHQEKEFLWNNKTIKIKRGQFITGRRQLQSEIKVNQHKIDRILNFFKTEHQIEQQMFPKFRLITIINYNKYQQSEPQNEPQVSHRRATSEPQVSTNNNDKNDNNEKNDKKMTIIYMSYKNKINQLSRLTISSKRKIKARLREYTLEQLLEAIDKFAKDSWWMEHNASRGIAWFFHSEDRIDQFLNITKRSVEAYKVKGKII